MSTTVQLFWALLAIAVSVIGAIVVRRRFPHEMLRQHNDVAGFIYAVLGVVYAVVLGLVLVSVWERASDAQSIVTREASILVAMFRGATALNDVDERAVQHWIRAYRDDVVKYEWEAMRNGETSIQSRKDLHEIYMALHAVEPKSERESVWLGKLIDDVDQLSDTRQARLESSRSSLPGLLWLVVLAGGVIVVAFSYLFGTPVAAPAILMIAALSATISLTVVTLAALDRPFSGAIRVPPDAFEQVDTVIQMWSARADSL